MYLTNDEAAMPFRVRVRPITSQQRRFRVRVSTSRGSKSISAEALYPLFIPENERSKHHEAQNHQELMKCEYCMTTNAIRSA